MRKLILVYFLLSGCAPTGYLSQEYNKEGRDFESKNGIAKIYVAREQGLVASSKSFAVSLNSKLRGYITNGAYLIFEVKEGKYEISVNTLESKSAESIDAKVGMNYFFRVEPHAGWNAARASLEQINEEEGKRIVKSVDRAIDFRKMCDTTTKLEIGMEVNNIAKMLPYLPLICKKGAQNYNLYWHRRTGTFFKLLFDENCSLVSKRDNWCEQYYYDNPIITKDNTVPHGQFFQRKIKIR